MQARPADSESVMVQNAWLDGLRDETLRDAYLGESCSTRTAPVAFPGAEVGGSR